MKKARKRQIIQLMDDLYWVKDICNVFLLRHGDRAIAIDFGTGTWLKQLPELGIRKLEHVFLTHHHADQCVGLQYLKRRPFQIHAPAGDEPYLKPSRVRQFWKEFHCCPDPFVLDKGIPRIRFDVRERCDFFWGPARIRFHSTPGHGENAHSMMINWCGKQVVFCGDAVHAGATIWKPHYLEWHIARGASTLTAWSGVRRLSQLPVDLLCPSHGLMIDNRPVDVLKQLSRKLMTLWEAKGCICVGQRDEYWPATPFGERSIRFPYSNMKLLPHLFFSGNNSYLLLSETGEALVVDLWKIDLECFKRLHARLGKPRVSAALCTHWHSDHTDGIPYLQQHYGTRVHLHPRVAKIYDNFEKYGLPEHGHATMLRGDALLPENGRWQWNEYEFRVAPFPVQTWWSAAHQTTVDGLKVFFGGDGFVPASQSGGTSGWCSVFDSRFREGIIRGAQLVLDWAPDIYCGAHGSFFKFQPAQFRKIKKWAPRAEKALADLCPSGDLDKDYHVHHFGEPRPYRDPASICRALMNQPVK